MGRSKWHWLNTRLWYCHQRIFLVTLIIYKRGGVRDPNPKLNHLTMGLRIREIKAQSKTTSDWFQKCRKNSIQQLDRPTNPCSKAVASISMCLHTYRSSRMTIGFTTWPVPRRTVAEKWSRMTATIKANTDVSTVIGHLIHVRQRICWCVELQI